MLNLLAALRDTPIVILHGPRQAGKSTLVQELAKKDHPAQYLTLDHLSTLSSARRDPEGFVASLSLPTIVDEIQRAPELVLSIKASVDRCRTPGRFLLTGSAHVLQLPRLADTLAGRAEIITLLPFSQGEMEGAREGFIDGLFDERPPVLTDVAFTLPGVDPREDLMGRVVIGGFPEVIGRQEPARRSSWFESYLSTMMLRDIRDLANIDGLTEMPHFLAMIASRAGGLLNTAQLARDMGLSVVTTKRYLSLLRSTFMVLGVRPWFTNRAKSLVKSEKLYLGDTGLLAHLLNVSVEEPARDPHDLGRLVENFVAVELAKQREWSRTRPEVFHFRNYSGTEVDFLLESRGGRRLVGLEVKASSTVRDDDFQGLRALAGAVGAKFHRGVVLYNGTAVIPFGSGMWAMPIAALWRWCVEPHPCRVESG